jgi:hypothetical protein
MNWTGGRLRRQSHNRPGSLSRIQKQYFARARLKLREISNRTASSQVGPTLAHNHRRTEESGDNKDGGTEEELRISQTRGPVSEVVETSQRHSEELSFSRTPHKLNEDPPYSELPHTERQVVPVSLSCDDFEVLAD